MSHFYSSIQGNRGEATRCGTKGSGIRATAQSWEGSISVIMDHDHNSSKNTYEIRATSGSGIGGTIIKEGYVEDLLKPGPIDGFEDHFNHLVGQQADAEKGDE
ncbi:MAG: hypothetical protein GY906_24610 [bacterium]|nr:hypothetical protein [bacterium]